MVRVSSGNIESSYPDDDDDYDYDNEARDSGLLFLSFYLTMIFTASLCCTIGALLCDIPVIIIQFVSTKVMNHIAFRTLVS